MRLLKSDFQILPFQPDDLKAVLRIERASYPFPWTAEQFLQEVANPVSALELLWIGEHLAGYMCYWLIVGEMQILNVATAPEFRGRGVAIQLLERALSCCAEKGLEMAWLEVRRGNVPAISLYQRMGFRIDGVRTRYYRDGEDALLMCRSFKAEEN